MKAVDWSVVSPFLTAGWLLYNLVWREVHLFCHWWEHLCHRSWFSASSRLVCYYWYSLASNAFILGASRSSRYCFFQRASLFPRSEFISYQGSLARHHIQRLSLFGSAACSCSSTILHRDSGLDSPVRPFPLYPLAAPSATVMATQPLATVPVILLGFLTSAPAALAPSSFPLMSSTDPSSATHLFFAAVISPFQAFLAMGAASFIQFQIVPEPAATSTPPRGSVIVLLCARSVRWDAEFTDLDAAFLAREDRIRELVLSLVESPPMKRTFVLK